MSKSKKLIFFGTEQFSLKALEALVENRFAVVAVVTKPDARKGRGKVLTPSAVKNYAHKHNIPVLQHDDINDIDKALEDYETDFAVLSAFGRIIPSSILSKLSGGIINIHPSLLPKYRGASPIEQAILNGNKETGVSLMRLVKAMDAGPVYAQSEVKLTGNETAPELYATLGELGSQLLIENLLTILNEQLRPTQQDDSAVTFAPIITKADGRIDWNDNTRHIERQIRAYLDWPSSKTTLGDYELTITKARLGEESGVPGKPFLHDNGFGVYCKDKSIIIEKLKPAGKREMGAGEFLAGYKVI